jgi:hypothetical protein
LAVGIPTLERGNEKLSGLLNLKIQGELAKKSLQGAAKESTFFLIFTKVGQ